ncbi:hypothetical protein E4M02_10610 [Brevundimonas sp. S30B]|uniref:PRC-barrel domain-containing protein n=1 Tax=unclassified Brevundimonas TaxID=2622653 RepID=UPI0010716E0E|nr:MULTISPECIES: PRC-barrel domain-containing protein [unclassified Brevundimonas]QBX38143.1 hypothetical protein E4M01_10445 [Brevundimonas sp. MF30-B]TFW01721.1 hypothetical protein E4M02_10610 [Brevundimonas sp. S30B]
MNRLILPVAASLGLALAACGDNTTDDVVQAPAEGAAPAPVTENRAATAATQTAVALGMTRSQLEDADLFAADRTKLGEVESIVLNPAGEATHLVIDLENSDLDVMVPIDQVRSINYQGDVDVTTDLTMAQLQALPPFQPAN